MVFYKLPSFKNYSGFISTIWTNALSAILVVLGIILFTKNGLYRDLGVSWYGLLWGVTFSISMVIYKTLLKGKEAGVLFPVMSSIGNIVTVGVGIVILSEKISPLQGLGILTILMSVFLFSKKKKESEDDKGRLNLTKKEIFLAIGLIVASTLQKYIQKMGADTTDVYHFMVYQYAGAMLFGIVLALFFDKNNFHEIVLVKKYLKGAFLISIFSILGGYTIFKALSLAPLSSVYAIHPSYTFISAILGVWLFKESLTKRKVILILLSIFGVILLRIG